MDSHRHLPCKSPHGPHRSLPIQQEGGVKTALTAKLRDWKLKSHIHRKGKRGKPLSEQGKGSNRTKSSVRVRVEHVFGAQANDMGGTLVRTIGLVRAKAKIGMKNLACNEEGKELIRGINSPTNAKADATAPPEPLPGVIGGADVRPRGRSTPSPGGTVADHVPKHPSKPFPAGFRRSNRH